MGVTLTDLRYIQVAAEEENITKAAEKLFVSQPSLSQRIKKVEDELGQELFVRTPAGLQLTEAGHLFVEMAHRVLHEYEMFSDHLRELGQPRGKKLVIGITPRRSQDILPWLVDAFTACYPDIQLVVRDVLSSHMEEELLAGKLDLGILHNPKLSPTIAAKVIRRDYFQLYLRSGSPLLPLARRSAAEGRPPCLPLSALKDEPLGVTRPGQRSRDVIDQLFRSEGIQPNIVHEMQTFDNMAMLADAGFCTLIEPVGYHRGAAGERVVRIKITSDHDVSLQTAMAYRSDRPYTKVYDTVYKILLRHLSNHSES